MGILARGGTLMICLLKSHQFILVSTIFTILFTVQSVVLSRSSSFYAMTITLVSNYNKATSK